MTTSDDVIVTVHHLHTVPSLTTRRGYCSRGARAWFKANGLDWAHFVLHGISARKLTATGDPMALRLARHAQEVVRGQR